STTVYLEGAYGVTLTDANGCTADASVPVNVNPLPDFCLLPTGCLETCLPDTICGPVSPTPGYYATYEWLQLDAACNPIAVVSTNQNFIVTAPGKYALVITTNTFPVCTDTSAPMEIEELICNDSCYASYDSAFKKILNNITINTSTVFSGKYFVDDNVIITVTNGATLDLTNVDMVFGKCAGIDFLNGAVVRANNSVFRPCNLSESWRGFEFRTGSGGIIDECVFKNAQRAVIFWGSNAQPTDARIMNNFFYNCKMNVVSVFGAFREPVTGNTFIVESTNIQYDNTSCPVYIPYTGQHWGVIGYFSDFQANVSHNDFIHASDPNNTKKFIGVYIVQGSGIFSENKFTNMYRSFDLQRARNSSIENNEIELTQQFTVVQNQIRGTDCSNMWVLSNEIENTFEYRSFILNSSAIYFNRGSGLRIKENNIQGFSNGIVLISTTSANIIENNIFNSNQNGIYLDRATNTDVACNMINMDDVVNSSASEIGIVHLQNTLNPSNNVFRNNCILETDVAMYFSSPLPPAGASPAQLPSILNNYMYSYTNAGIRVINFSGSIGTAAGSFSTGGRNTFISNNVPNGTPDIESNVYLLNEAGNFGINLLVLVNSLGPKNEYHSTASCGHQIENNLQGITPNPGQEITAVERCDPYVNSTVPAKLVYNGDVILNSDFVERLEEIAYDDRLDLLIDLLSILSDNQNTQEMDLLLSSVMSSSLLNAQDFKWFEFYYYKSIQDYVQAKALLNYVPIRNKDEVNLQLIETILLDMAISGNDFHLLNAYRKMQLTMIDNERGKYASLARDVLNLAIGGHSYIFEDLEKAKEFEIEDSDLLALIGGNLEVFPNPFEDEVSIKYYVNDATEVDLKLYDLGGREITNYSWKYSGAKIALDLSKLSKGAYIIVVYNNNNIASRAKLIKQ
ncbi:MAG: T9SS type A sorting domain-containing protein, partial [Chitinophagales bacterium]|nr:T9SS type A sorting domain-containing protein [Chitinophagales bacterium]